MGAPGVGLTFCEVDGPCKRVGRLHAAGQGGSAGGRGGRGDS